MCWMGAPAGTRSKQEQEREGEGGRYEQGDGLMVRPAVGKIAREREERGVMLDDLTAARRLKKAERLVARRGEERAKHARRSTDHTKHSSLLLRCRRLQRSNPSAALAVVPRSSRGHQRLGLQGRPIWQQETTQKAPERAPTRASQKPMLRPKNTKRM